MSDPLPFKGRSVSVTAVLLQDTDTAQIDESLSAKIAQVPPDFFATQPLVADLSALQDFKPDSKWLKTLKRIFERHQLPLVGVCGAPVERSALIAAGLAEVTISADNKTKTVAAEKSEAVPPPPPLAAPAVKAAPARKFTLTATSPFTAPCAAVPSPADRTTSPPTSTAMNSMPNSSPSPVSIRTKNNCKPARCAKTPSSA